jgi:uncharacterized protein (TIGR03435 family)
MNTRFKMRNVRGIILSAALLVATGAAFAQTPRTAPVVSSSKLTFDVATVKPSPPPDMAKLQADMQAGRMPKFGPHIEATRAEYNFMSLKDLIAMAYKIKTYQVTGPDWLGTTRFDIVATIPEGASKDDAPAMLKALLIDRFKLAAHLDTQEHPVLGLLVGKGGVKLKESTVAALPIDENAPLKPGEMKMDTPDGPARMTRNPDGSGTVNMGEKGTFTQKMDGQNLRIEASTINMAGFADMLTQMMQIGGGAGRQVVDMTGLKGNYQVAVELSMADLIASARAAGVDVPNGPGGAGSGGAAGGAAAADAGPSDPSGGTTVYESVQRLGLKLESRKAPIEQLVIDHAEKTPTEN